MFLWWLPSNKFLPLKCAFFFVLDLMSHYGKG